jgi:dihydroneopterin aldolase
VTERPKTQPQNIADAKRRIRHVFVDGLEVRARIGVYWREKIASQPVRISVDLAVQEQDAPVDDRLANVVDYAKIAEGVRAIVDEGHYHLVETLAERVAAFALQDKRVLTARVRVEKLKAIAKARAVGVEIERARE